MSNYAKRKAATLLLLTPGTGGRFANPTSRCYSFLPTVLGLRRRNRTALQLGRSPHRHRSRSWFYLNPLGRRGDSNPLNTLTVAVPTSPCALETVPTSEVSDSSSAATCSALQSGPNADDGPTSNGVAPTVSGCKGIPSIVN